MFVIQIDEYFDNQETPCDSIIEGYFTTREFAHEYLINNGYKYDVITSCWGSSGCIDEEYYELISETELTDYHARIIELELIK